jgi:hypothetical protein
MWATCPRSASSGYHADFHEGHGTIGEWQGRGMAWQGNGMGAAWYVWISLKKDGEVNGHCEKCGVKKFVSLTTLSVTRSI